jgi:hypothetical protein
MSAPASCTEEIVGDYEALVVLAREQTASLRRGDLSSFARIVERKGEIVGRIQSAVGGGGAQRTNNGASVRARTSDALAARAESALVALLELESEALALITGLRDAIGNELSLVARGDAGLRSYRGGSAARLVDERR